MTLGSHQSRGVLPCVLSKQMPGAASSMLAILLLCDNQHQPAQPLQMVVISLPVSPSCTGSHWWTHGASRRWSCHRVLAYLGRGGQA